MTSPSPSAAPLAAETATALQAALGAENAALWVYGLVKAFLPHDYDSSITDAMSTHRARRYATESTLSAAGVTPQPAETGYRTPQPVTTEPTAIAAVVAAETDATVAWRAVLERTDDAVLRKTALAALTNSAVRATRWRRAGHLTPLTPPLPGSPQA